MNETLEFLKRLAEEINTQENYGTAEPIYSIQELKSTPVAIPGDHTKTHWFNDNGEVAEGEQANMLQAYWEKHGMEPEGWNLEHFREEWVHTGRVYLTLQSARDFVEGSGDDDLRVYVDSAHYNHEIKELRRLLSGPLLQSVRALKNAETMMTFLMEKVRDKAFEADTAYSVVGSIESKLFYEVRNEMREALRQTLERPSFKESESRNRPGGG